LIEKEGFGERAGGKFINYEAGPSFGGVGKGFGKKCTANSYKEHIDERVQPWKIKLGGGREGRKEGVNEQKDASNLTRLTKRRIRKAGQRRKQIQS